MRRIFILKHAFTIAAAGLVNLLAAYSSHAQANRFPSDRDNKVILELNYTPSQKINLSVSEIEIMNARFNQSNIGVTTGLNLISNNEFSRKDIIFPAQFATYVSGKLYN